MVRLQQEKYKWCVAIQPAQLLTLPAHKLGDGTAQSDLIHSSVYPYPHP